MKINYIIKNKNIPNTKNIINFIEQFNLKLATIIINLENKKKS